MPIPLVLAAILEVIGAALALYEALDVLHDIYEGLDKYNKGIEQAKKELEKTISSLKDEIDKKISEKEQVTMLLAAAGTDPQNPKTKRGDGWGTDKPVIKAAIQQRIPFRRIISEVCDKAEAMPVLQLRKKKGITVKDLPKAKRKALEEILRVGLDNIADVDLDQFVLVRLKQFAASLMFEFVNYCLDWASPMKAEVTFGPAKAYNDPPLDGTTRLKRVGKVSPFYPFPPPNNRQGSLSADLIINEYRKEPTGKNNLFAIVEIKFEGDKLDAEQFIKYENLLKEAAKEKTRRSPIRYNNKPVSSGGRLSLFRYPLDKPETETDEEKKRKTGRKGKGR